MGVFDHFPYTNFHELNLNWIVNEIKKLVNDYEKLNGLFKDFEELKQYVIDYFNNADFLDDIETILLQMVTDGIINVSNVNFESVKVMNGNNVLEMMENGLYLQGGCYVENGVFVYAAVSYNSNDNDLVAVDMNTGTELWRYNLPIEHANAIAYRKYDRKLYIAPCETVVIEQGQQTTQYSKNIYVVDYDNPSAVVETIVSPARGFIYSIAYDETSDTFYSTNFTGNVDGDSNVLFEYNGIFTSVKNEITLLDDYAVANTPALDNQGVQCVHNGVAWIVYYNPTRIIAGFDVKTGEKLVEYTIPKVFNKYSQVGEMQFMTCNDNDYYIGYAQPHHNSGIRGMHKICIAEIPVIHNVAVQEMRLGTGGNIGNHMVTQPGGVYTCKLDRNRVSKFPNYHFTNFSSWNDIITYAKCNSIRPNITFETNTDQNYELFAINAWDVDFGMTKPADGNVRIVGSYFSNIKGVFQNVIFEGSESFNGYLVNGSRVNRQPDNVSFWGMSEAVLWGCTFSNVTNNQRAIGIYEGSHVTLMAATTFNNTYLDVKVANGSRFTDNKTINGIIGLRDTDVDCDANSTVDNMALLGRWLSLPVNGSVDTALTNARVPLADNKLFVIGYSNGGASWRTEYFQNVVSNNIVTMRITNTAWVVDVRLNTSTKKIGATLVSGSVANINIFVGYISS